MIMHCLAIPVGFGCDADVGFEEAVEESDVVKAEVECNLFDLEVGYLQLALGVGDNRLNDNVSRRSVADSFNSGAEVR